MESMISAQVEGALSLSSHDEQSRVVFVVIDVALIVQRPDYEPRATLVGPSTYDHHVDMSGITIRPVKHAAAINT